MDALRRDDIDSARELSPKDKLSQALEVMAYGLTAKRQNLQRRTSNASANEVDKDFDAWLFDGH
ncbi:MAG TPA: hypothetical protein VIV60_29695 [Polyangiaceae bacterium]